MTVPQRQARAFAAPADPRNRIPRRRTPGYRREHRQDQSLSSRTLSRTTRSLPHPGTAGRLPGRQRLLPEHSGSAPCRLSSRCARCSPPCARRQTASAPTATYPSPSRSHPTWSTGTSSRWRPWAKELKLDGIIAINTTIAREGLGLTSDMTKVRKSVPAASSGAPLKPRSLEVPPAQARNRRRPGHHLRRRDHRRGRAGTPGRWRRPGAGLHRLPVRGSALGGTH